MKHTFPSLPRPLLLTASLTLAAGLLLRIVLWWVFGRTAGAGWAGLALALPLGAINDGIALLSLTFPLTLVLALTPHTVRQGRFWRGLSWVALATLIFALLYLACVEYFFFDEFNGRFNLVAVDYLIYPHEVFVNIWESYHVLRYLLACGLTTAGLFVLVRHWLSRSQPLVVPSARSRWLFAGGHLLVLLLALACLSTDSLSLSTNRVTNEILTNGISSLFRALHTNELDYTAFYPTMNTDRAFALIREELGGHGDGVMGQAPREITRQFPARPGLGKRNVVVIVEESFGAQFVGAYGSHRGLTPNFDRLASQGTLFANAFASGTRTVRGLEAIVTSLPPIPSESVIKRPGSWPIAHWGGVLERHGYHTSFLYGGYGLFDNMNPFFGGNGFALVDRHDISPVTFSNIWGVCDQDLFHQAIRYFDDEAGRQRPFFSVIMTTSNHSPYTFPAGIPQVKAAGGGRNDGIRYADFALGEFLANSADHAWYANTVFVVVADHDARVYGKEQIPLRHYRIPLLILAPEAMPPQVVTTATSQIDIAPTVMGLLGLAYEAPFYGQDVLRLPAAEPHPILLNHDHDVGLLLGTHLAVLGLQQERHSYQVGDHDELTTTDPDPTLSDLAISYFQTAFTLFQGHAYQLPTGRGAER